MKIFGILLILSLCTLFAFSAEQKEGNSKGDIIHLADSLNKLADLSVSYNPGLALSSVNEAYTMSVQIKYIKGQADALTFLSNYYLGQEDYVRTLEVHFKMIDLYDHQHKVDNLIIAYSRLVQFFLQIKDRDLAEKYLQIMSRLVQQTQNPATHGQVFLSQAKFYLANREYDLAIRNLYLCIPYFQKAGNLPAEGAVYKFLGDAFVQKKQYFKADYAYRTAVTLSFQMPNLAEVAIIYTRIAHIYQSLNNNPKNLEYNLNAMHIREKIGQSMLIASSYLNVGEAYWLLGRKDSANVFLRKSLNLAKQINSTYLLEAIYYQLYDFANTEKRYSDALNYYTTCIGYRQKMTRERTSSEIAILVANRTINASETQNDLMRQENLIQELQISKRKIQTILFEVAFIILLSLLLFVITLARNNRRRKNELKILNERLKQEIYEGIEAEGRLNRSEELHRFLAENTVDVISLLDANMRRKYISPSCEKFYGYNQQELLAMESPLDLVEPSFREEVNQHLKTMFLTKKTTRYIYKALRKDGSLFWAETNINPFLDPATNEINDLITVVRDISERMKHEQELAENSRQKEYLLREIHNRVKNNFTILTSLMTMQRDQSHNTELNQSLTDLQLRVRTMSLVHEQLYQDKEISSIPFDNYLQNLTLIISSSFNNPRIQLQTDIRPCQIAIEMALPMGLIINELITNVYKYAFPEPNTGTLWVKLLPEAEERFSITICDNGIGLPEDFTMKATKSMGTQIVEILIQQVEATLEVTNNGGACFRILFSPNQQ